MKPALQAGQFTVRPSFLDGTESTRWQAGHRIVAGIKPPRRLANPRRRRANKKRSAETKAAPEAPTKGRTEQHKARRSLGGSVGQALLLFFKGPKAQVGRFSGSRDLTLTRRSNCRLRPLSGPIDFLA